MSEPDLPLLHTKLHRPLPGDGTMNRPRLLASLNESLGRAVILVTAPAGYGKTTLVSSWIEATGRPYAWLSLDPNDNDLATFVAYLIAAVRSGFPGLGEAAAAALRAPALPGPALLADLFLRDLAGLSHPQFLVLDDYHVVVSQDARAFMNRLIQYMPGELHLVLVARADPNLVLGRLRGRQQVAEIRSADLRFTVDEAGDLVQRITGSDPPLNLIHMLTERTEGWPVGLQLAAISLRASADPEAFARRFAQSNSRVLMDYLVGEVLERLPEMQRTQLLYTSILDRFCAPLCEAVSGKAMAAGRGADFVAALQRANLFVVDLDDEGVWHRYHHLFRDLLRHELRLNTPARKIADLHRRASAWFEDAGLTEEAIAHAIEAGDGLRAAQLVEANGSLLLSREDWRRLERWLALMPEPMLQRPALLVAQAYLQHFRHRVAAIFPLIEAAERGLDDDVFGYTPAQRQKLLGAINTLRSTSFFPGDPERIVRSSATALQQLGHEMVFERSLAELWQIYGLQQSGQTAAAVELGRRLLAEQAGEPDVRTLRHLLALSGVYYDEADLPAVLAIGATFREVALRTRRALSLGWANFVLGWAHYQRNELDLAAEHLAQVVESSHEVHSKAATDCFIGLALTRHAQGREADARDLVEGLRTLLLDRGMVNLMPVADALALRIGNAPEPPDAPSAFVNDLAGQMAADPWNMPGLTAVHVALRSGAPNQLAAAAEILVTCRQLAEARNMRRRCIEIAALEGCVHAARGDDAAALEATRQAVRLGEPGGGIRFFLDAGPGVRPYLQQLLNRNVAPAYIHAILAAYASEDAGRPPVPALPPPGEKLVVRGTELSGLLTNREIDVLLLLEQRLTNKEIAARLMISPRTVQKHTINLYEKLHASNRREVVAHARALGLLPNIS